MSGGPERVIFPIKEDTAGWASQGRMTKLQARRASASLVRSWLGSSLRQASRHGFSYESSVGGQISSSQIGTEDIRSLNPRRSRASLLAERVSRIVCWVICL